MGITELDACISFANANNCLDPREFFELLAPEAVYSSELLNEPIIGKEAIAGYCSKRIQAGLDGKMIFSADLTRFFLNEDDLIMWGAEIKTGDPKDAINWQKARNGVILNQQNLRENLRLFVFQVEGEFIQKIEVRHPLFHDYYYFLRKDSPAYPLMENT